MVIYLAEETLIVDQLGHAALADANAKGVINRKEGGRFVIKFVDRRCVLEFIA